MAGKKRVRDVPLYVWVRPDELEAIRGRMEEAGIRNMSAYIRKMALNGYILHVDLSPVQELVSLQRRCANNLNQVATHANSYGVYQEEIKSLQKDYADLWGAAVRPAPEALRGGASVTKGSGPAPLPGCPRFWPVWPEAVQGDRYDKKANLR